MNGHARSKPSASQEENLGLLDEKSHSEIDSESGRGDPGTRYKMPQWTDSAVDNINYVRSVPWNAWRVLLMRGLIFLLPSFVQSRFTRQQHRPEKLSPTSYLDGMRGLAALFVFFCHFSYQFFIIAEAYGSGPANNNWLKLPIIRLFYQGPPAVCLFFVISGYALSYKPVKLIRSLQFDNFATTMSSMTFRRVIRLYLPTAISTFLILVMIRLGIYEQTRAWAKNKTYLKNITEVHPEPLETLYDQLTHWVWCMFKFIHIFSWDKFAGSNHYDVHLWTIAVEYRCSMYLFATIIGVARLRTCMRFIVMFIVMGFVYRNSRWDLMLFYFGTVIAEHDVIRGAHVPQPALPTEQKEPHKGTLRGVAWTALSVLGLFLMSQPDSGGKGAPGWRTLTAMIPEWWTEEPFRYWQSVGAMMFVLSVAHSPRWQRVFNTPVIQYLGKISYALYLMHGPVIHTVGYMIEMRAFAFTGIEGYWYNAGFALSAIGVIPSVIWAADVFWRMFDVPTVKFARWLENKLIVKQE